MKTLIVIRHGKAEKKKFGELDSKRKLTSSGILEVENMAKRLLEKNYQIEKIFSSSAERTRQTSKIFALIHQVEDDRIQYFDSLYLSDASHIVETLYHIQDEVQTLAIVGHNPGVTHFSSSVTHSYSVILPPAGIAVIKAHCDDWTQFEAANKTLVEVLLPTP